MFKLKPPTTTTTRRRPLCQSCDQSPATFLCKADDASLCSACDAQIHSANPLARRHHRIPILQLEDDQEEDAGSTWLKSNAGEMLLFGGVVDDYLDLDEYTGGGGGGGGACHFGDHHHHHHHPFGTLKPSPAEDSVVPKSQVLDHGSFHLAGGGVDYDAGFTFPNSSLSPNVSLSSTDVGIVPDAEGPIPHQRPPKGTIDLFTGCHVQIPNQLSAEDREARVLRYREKKKNRKFEKTIRYASRKAYAEIRPRIKGRFAKRTHEDGGRRLMSETGAYGIVPSLF